MDVLPLTVGRRLYGSDPAAYANARPDYPPSLYETLASRCGLRPALSILEVGAGTGVATKRLLSVGVSRLHAIEPDPNFAAYLRLNLRTTTLEVDESPFEETVLQHDTFDLGVAATSFHWLEQSSALSKVYRVLKPGGWWAMWWMIYQSNDPFSNATDHLFVGIPQTPAVTMNPFDRDHRVQDMLTAGLRNTDVEEWQGSRQYDTAGVIELYDTFAPVRALQPEDRKRFLDELASITERQFGGQVEIPLSMILYIGQRPVGAG